MVLPATQLTIELIPHCTSVPRDGWAGSHDIRPLARLGMRQAEALAAVIGSGVDGIYRMLRAVTLMMDAHPGGRAAAASHGDVVPVLLATLSSAYAIPRPRHLGRGGWYTLQFTPGSLAVTPHDPVPA
jgi:broad specificity phosphatase PhoE